MPLHYHLIGIAGTAMGSLAGLLHARGHQVTGSDEGVYPPMSTLLDSLGIAYAPSFEVANLSPTPDVVVVGNAISRGNPELEAVLDRGLRHTSAASLTREEFLEGKHVLAVAGTHGKTTTSALLAWILESAGLDPSFLVGGVCRNFNTSFRLTESEHFVIEADEYDTAYFDKGPKMWHYRPRTAVLTNVEFDHADIYRDAEAYQFAFARYINLVPRSGTLVSGWSSPVAKALSEASRAPVESFGLDASESEEHPRWRATDVQVGPEGTQFLLLHERKPLGAVRTRLWGAFNVENCLAAIAAAHAVGAEFEAIRRAVDTFESVGRRLEVRGEVEGVTVIDDFAHHPSAVRGVIAAARERFPNCRVVSIFEPRSYTSQRREFQQAYQEALRDADRVVLAGLFHPERYDTHTAMEPESLVRSLRSDGVVADYLPDVDQIVECVASESRPGDVLLVLSNGGFGGIHQKLLDRLGAKSVL